MRLTLHLHLRTAIRPSVLQARLDALVATGPVDLVLSGRDAGALAAALTWPAGAISSATSGPILAREALALAAERETATVLASSDVRLAPHALAFAQAVAQLDHGAALASLQTPRQIPEHRPPFMPWNDGGDGLFAAIDPGLAVVVTPAQARDLAEQGVAGRPCLFPRTALAASDDLRFDRGLERGPRDWKLLPMTTSLARYDERLQMLPEALKRIAPSLAGHDFAVDLFGDAPSSSAPLLLSARPCAAPILSFGLERTPAEANIAFGEPGSMFSLAPREAFGPMTTERRTRLLRHFHRTFNLVGYIRHLIGARFRRPARAKAGAAAGPPVATPLATREVSQP